MIDQPAARHAVSRADAIARFKEQIRLGAIGYSERFEAIAERFYRETGFLAPGKSVPLEMSSEDHEERRTAVWAAFQQRERETFYADLQFAIDVLAAAPVPCAASPVDPVGPSCGHKTPMVYGGAGDCGTCYVFDWDSYAKAKRLRATGEGDAEAQIETAPAETGAPVQSVRADVPGEAVRVRAHGDRALDAESQADAQPVAVSHRLLVDLLLEEIREHFDEHSNYCWWCQRDVNGRDLAAPEPHDPLCWYVRVQAELARLRGEAIRQEPQ
jgi:hypothetical protein